MCIYIYIYIICFRPDGPRVRRLLGSGSEGGRLGKLPRLLLLLLIIIIIIIILILLLLRFSKPRETEEGSCHPRAVELEAEVRVAENVSLRSGFCEGTWSPLAYLFVLLLVVILPSGIMMYFLPAEFTDIAPMKHHTFLQRFLTYLLSI